VKLLLDWVCRRQAEEGDLGLKAAVFTEFAPTQEMLYEFLSGRVLSAAGRPSPGRSSAGQVGGATGFRQRPLQGGEKVGGGETSTRPTCRGKRRRAARRLLKTS